MARTRGVVECQAPLKWRVIKVCGNATRHLSGAKKQDHKNPIYSGNLSSTAMALTAEQVLDMLDSSDESEIEEDPEFLLPQNSDIDIEEPVQSKLVFIDQYGK